MVVFWRESSANPEKAYPSQGLRLTEYDGVPLSGVKSTLLSQKSFLASIEGWLYYLELFNHPQRLKHLWATDAIPFIPPRRIFFHPIFDLARWQKRAISIDELALHAGGADRPRTQRKKRFEEGPFIKLGRQARSIFVGSANPEVWGSAPAIASMAMAHCLVGIPRDGVFKNVKRQVDLTIKVMEWLAKSPILVGRADQKKLLHHWQHNLMGVLEADGAEGLALTRAAALYKVGVRTFRIYSPEPALETLETLIALRKLAKKSGWQPIEIFVGQVVSVEQAQHLEKAGADGIYIGIGGGGRCTTGVRANVAIDWPQLVWSLRGKIAIPVIVEGGASENIATTLAVGATGIGVTRIVGGGTIESPGGRRYFYQTGKPSSYFKPYGGEASARMKAMGGRIGPLGTIPYVEGETTVALLPEGRGNIPTLLQRLFLLMGDQVMGLVFQNYTNTADLQQRGPHSLRLVSPTESHRRQPH